MEPSVVAVGFFDGVHKGHQHVILKAKEIAEQTGEKWGVMTFDPHPSVVLKGVSNARYLTPLPVKEKLIEDLGADYLFIVPFTKELASLSPKRFVDEFFAGLRISHVVAGFDFSFGHKGKGSMEIIDELADNQFSTTTVKKVEESAEKISSTRIRHLLDAGEISKVNELLGRPYEVRGTHSVDGVIDIPSYYHLPLEGMYQANAEEETVTVTIRQNQIFLDESLSKEGEEINIAFLEKL
ncbi:riboflavin kinase / FMN adenylyltransferase [Salimicrobium halophilum]|uniref:FAD synthase n=1 Tax=Salimicrobium halophilum TaxID=86666 RepID=A0A1G8Q8X8_9BACI|nr:riboflavin kinase / FMN adenylyltransferase [Salimicrobium halophilum]